jgi:hypothetical protein
MATRGYSTITYRARNGLSFPALAAPPMPPFAPWSRLTPTNWLVWLLAQSPVHFALEGLIVGVVHKVYVL